MRLDINKVLCAFFIAVPASAEVPLVRARYLMGTVCEITAYGAKAGSAVNAAFEEIARWEEILSLHRPESELSALNREAASAPWASSKRLWSAVSSAMDIARRSGGAFDPTIAPVIKSGLSALPSVGYAGVTLDPAARTITYNRPGMAMDMGAIGKGIALDDAAEALRRRGVRSALLNFGGQVYALGSPPGQPGWTVRLPGLTRPLRLKNASASVSGNGEKPGHVLSPFSGLPVHGGDAAVVMPRAAEADAWSTALFVLNGAVPKEFDGCLIRQEGDAASPACRRYKGD